jgi:hypothetical protein
MNDFESERITDFTKYKEAKKIGPSGDVPLTFGVVEEDDLPENFKQQVQKIKAKGFSMKKPDEAIETDENINPLSGTAKEGYHKKQQLLEQSVAELYDRAHNTELPESVKTPQALEAYLKGKGINFLSDNILKDIIERAQQDHTRPEYIAKLNIDLGADALHGILTELKVSPSIITLLTGKQQEKMAA